MTSIAQGAFEGCSALANDAIHTSVASIEQYDFYGCSSLTNVDISASVARSLASVTISTSTTTISAHAFARCGALAAVIIKPAADNNTSDADAEAAPSWGELEGT